MKIIENAETFQGRFYSFGEFLAYLKSNPPAFSGASSRMERDAEWAGTRTFEEAVALAETGDAEIGRIIQKESAKMSSLIFGSIPKPDVAYSVRGQVIDVGKYLDGIPECVLRE